jgi:hypothetical protein
MQNTTNVTAVTSFDGDGLRPLFVVRCAYFVVRSRFFSQQSKESHQEILNYETQAIEKVALQL